MNHTIDRSETVLVEKSGRKYIKLIIIHKKQQIKNYNCGAVNYHQITSSIAYATVERTTRYIHYPIYNQQKYFTIMLMTDAGCRIVHNKYAQKKDITVLFSKTL